MAKAKKTTGETTAKKTAAPKAEKPAAEKKTAAKAPAKKAAAKLAAPAQTGLPQIDTNFAAQSAATMLRNRAATGDANVPQAGGAAKPESSSFKNFKDQLAKPKSTGLGNLLGPGPDAKKSTGHFFNQQKGHNQTAGGFNKTGVPRRTNG